MSKGTHFIGQPLFGQLISLLDKSKILKFSREKDGERYVKHFNAWQHMVIMLYAIIKRFDSLREITDSMFPEARKLSHLGINMMPRRSTLSDANARRSESIFEATYRDLYATYKDELSSDSRKRKTPQWMNRLQIIDSTIDPSPVKSINLGLYVARIIHNDLAVANASAWQWWRAVSLGEDVPIQLLPMKDSSQESVKYDGIISPTKMFWTTANYSFFIRPGMKRIDVKPHGKKVTDLEAATSLMVSSYTDGNEVVTVIINYTDKDEPMELKLDKAKKGKVYVTSMDKNLEYAGEQGLKKLVVPARSVVTVVI